MSEKEKLVYCSFCGLSDEEVNSMICGPSGVVICNECVCICIDTLTKRKNFPEYDRATNKAEVTP